MLGRQDQVRALRLGQLRAPRSVLEQQLGKLEEEWVPGQQPGAQLAVVLVQLAVVLVQLAALPPALQRAEPLVVVVVVQLVLGQGQELQLDQGLGQVVDWRH